MAGLAQDDPSHACLLLSLPPELLELILIRYFEGSSLAVSYTPNGGPCITGVPSLNLEQTCKNLRLCSLVTRTRHIPRHLDAGNKDLLYDALEAICQSTSFAWARNHITSMQFTMHSTFGNFTRKYWRVFFQGFPNIRAIKAHALVFENMPSRIADFDLRDENSQRKLARDVVAGPFEWPIRRGTIKVELNEIERAYLEDRGTYASWCGFGSSSALQDKLNLTLVLSTKAFRGSDFYLAV